MNINNHLYDFLIHLIICMIHYNLPRDILLLTFLSLTKNISCIRNTELGLISLFGFWMTKLHEIIVISYKSYLY